MFSAIVINLRLAVLALTFPALLWLAGEAWKGQAMYCGLLVVALVLCKRQAVEVVPRLLGLLKGGG